MASEMTSLGAERTTADAIRDLADQYGVKMPRALAAIEAGWRMLSDEQKRDAMFLVADAAQPTTGQQSSSGSALIRAETADASAQSEQGEDMQSEHDAGPHSPPASTEPQSSANSAEAPDDLSESSDPPIQKQGAA